MTPSWYFYTALLSFYYFFFKEVSPIWNDNCVPVMRLFLLYIIVNLLNKSNQINISFFLIYPSISLQKLNRSFSVSVMKFMWRNVDETWIQKFVAKFALLFRLNKIIFSTTVCNTRSNLDIDSVKMLDNCNKLLDRLTCNNVFECRKWNTVSSFFKEMFGQYVCANLDLYKNTPHVTHNFSSIVKIYIL